MKTIRQVIQVSVVTLFILSMSVSVEAMTGNELIEHCDKFGVEVTSEDWQQNAYCMGYIVGVIHGMEYLDFKKQICIPTKNVKQGQIIKVVIKYLNDNPQRLHEQYTHIIYLAITEAFPCNKN
jgi:hypothetical protein